MCLASSTPKLPEPVKTPEIPAPAPAPLPPPAPIAPSQDATDARNTRNRSRAGRQGTQALRINLALGTGGRQSGLNLPQ